MGVIDLTSDIGSVRRNETRQSDQYHNERDIDLKDVPTGGFMLNRGLICTRALFIVTGSYQPQVRRSFSANVGGDAVTDLANIVNRDETADILSLSRVANSIIVPSARVDKHINIQNGWAEPRCRFYLEFVKPLSQDSNILYCYTGYTDYVGIDHHGNIDPSMPLHITNVTTISNNMTRDGVRNRRVRTDNSILVRSSYYDDESIKDRHGYSYTNKEYMIDPRSAILGAGYNKVMGDSRDYEWQRDAMPMYSPDHSSLGVFAKNVERSHHIPAYYLSKLINVTRVANEQDGMDMYDSGQILQGGPDITRTRTLNHYLTIDDFAKDPLANLFSESTNIVSDASLRWHDILEYWPSIEDNAILSVIFPAGVRQTGGDRFSTEIRKAGEVDLDSDSWDGANQETMIATMIAQQLPNLMLSELIESIRFSVTNDSYSSLEERWHWTVGDHRRGSRDNRSAISFIVPSASADFQRLRFDAFRCKFEEVILSPITMDGAIDLHLMIDCDIQGSCRIVIQFSSGREYRFVAPTFAGSMTSSLVTSSVDHYNDFTTSITNLVDDVVG